MTIQGGLHKPDASARGAAESLAHASGLCKDHNSAYSGLVDDFAAVRRQQRQHREAWHSVAELADGAVGKEELRPAGMSRAPVVAVSKAHARRIADNGRS